MFFSNWYSNVIRNIRNTHTNLYLLVDFNLYFYPFSSTNDVFNKWILRRCNPYTVLYFSSALSFLCRVPIVWTVSCLFLDINHFCQVFRSVIHSLTFFIYPIILCHPLPSFLTSCHSLLSKPFPYKSRRVLHRSSVPIDDTLQSSYDFRRKLTHKHTECFF